MHPCRELAECSEKYGYEFYESGDLGWKGEVLILYWCAAMVALRFNGAQLQGWQSNRRFERYKDKLE